jgi:hypothetical protein
LSCMADEAGASHLHSTLIGQEVEKVASASTGQFGLEAKLYYLWQHIVTHHVVPLRKFERVRGRNNISAEVLTCGEGAGASLGAGVHHSFIGGHGTFGHSLDAFQTKD